MNQTERRYAEHLERRKVEDDARAKIKVAAATFELRFIAVQEMEEQHCGRLERRGVLITATAACRPARLRPSSPRAQED